MPFFENKNLELNPIELACLRRKEQNLPLTDLTCSNPTLQGYLFPSEILIAETGKYLSSRIYDPHPRGFYDARHCIAAYYVNRGLNISPEHIIITANTSEAYCLLFSLLCEAGDNILTPNITYPLFEFLAEHQKIKMKSFHFRKYSNSTDTGWNIDFPSILENHDSRTKALMFISPHNPLGHIIEEKKEEIVTHLGLPIICDEVFAEFTGNETPPKPVGAIYPDLPVFHLNGISKMFALPDMKLGWIAMNDTALDKYGDRLELLNDMFLSASPLIQAALPAIFEAGTQFKKEMVKSVNKKVKTAVQIINSSNRLKTHFPAGGYYVFPEIICDGHKSSKKQHDINRTEEEIVLKLIENGVLVHPGYFYGNCPTPHIMISCLVKEENLLGGLEKIAA